MLNYNCSFGPLGLVPTNPTGPTRSDQIPTAIHRVGLEREDELCTQSYRKKAMIVFRCCALACWMDDGSCSLTHSGSPWTKTCSPPDRGSQCDFCPVL